MFGWFKSKGRERQMIDELLKLRLKQLCRWFWTALGGLVRTTKLPTSLQMPAQRWPSLTIARLANCCGSPLNDGDFIHPCPIRSAEPSLGKGWVRVRLCPGTKAGSLPTGLTA